MKPSELKSAKTRKIERDGEPVRISQRADPPITQDEANKAGTSICRWHNGLVEVTGDKDGAVFYCPIGKMYWRYRKPGKKDRPIKYNFKGIV